MRFGWPQRQLAENAHPNSPTPNPVHSILAEEGTFVQRISLRRGERMPENGPDGVFRRDRSQPGGVELLKKKLNFNCAQYA